VGQAALSKSPLSQPICSATEWLGLGAGTVALALAAHVALFHGHGRAVAWGCSHMLLRGFTATRTISPRRQPVDP